MSDTLTITAAARICHCDRRTLQRAIHAGRLHLDAQHCLSREALIAAGYLVVTMPQETPLTAPQVPPLVAPHQSALLPLLERLATALERLGHEIHCLRDDLRQTPQWTPQPVPQETPQRQRRHSAATPQGTPQETPQKSDTAQEAPRGTPLEMPPFDASKFILGKLCPRGHDYYGTGKTLRRVFRHVCPTCDVERTRTLRQARREGTQSGEGAV